MKLPKIYLIFTCFLTVFLFGCSNMEPYATLQTGWTPVQSEDLPEDFKECRIGFHGEVGTESRYRGAVIQLAYTHDSFVDCGRYEGRTNEASRENFVIGVKFGGVQ